jgi:hypothetical protein
LLLLPIINSLPVDNLIGCWFSEWLMSPSSLSATIMSRSNDSNNNNNNNNNSENVASTTNNSHSNHPPLHSHTNIICNNIVASKQSEKDMIDDVDDASSMDDTQFAVPLVVDDPIAIMKLEHSARRHHSHVYHHHHRHHRHRQQSEEEEEAAAISRATTAMSSSPNVFGSMKSGFIASSLPLPSTSTTTGASSSWFTRRSPPSSNHRGAGAGAGARAPSSSPTTSSASPSSSSSSSSSSNRSNGKNECQGAWHRCGRAMSSVRGHVSLHSLRSRVRGGMRAAARAAMLVFFVMWAIHFHLTTQTRRPAQLYDNRYVAVGRGLLAGERDADAPAYGHIHCFC